MHHAYPGLSCYDVIDTYFKYSLFTRTSGLIIECSPTMMHAESEFGLTPRRYISKPCLTQREPGKDRWLSVRPETLTHRGEIATATKTLQLNLDALCSTCSSDEEQTRCLPYIFLILQQSKQFHNACLVRNIQLTDNWVEASTLCYADCKSVLQVVTVILFVD